MQCISVRLDRCERHFQLSLRRRLGSSTFPETFCLESLAFICVDGAVFHSGLYVSILAPSSYAGRIWRITRTEKERAPSGLKEVLVLGDSRIAEGFSATLANELGSPAGLKFVSLAEPAASANTWYYMVREVDPTTRRYAAIVIPYGIGYEPNNADPLRISMTAPLLRYGDGFHFASGFQRSSGRFRAFMACILRGSAYQDDVVDLLSHPVARMRSIQQADEVHAGREYKGRDYDLVGTSYDAATGQVTFAPKLTEAQRLAFRKSLIQPSQSDTEYSLKLQRDWIPRIMDRYSHSPTAIVLTPLPRGPFLELGGLSRAYGSVLPTSVVEGTRFSLPGHTFDFLEKPEYYFDAFHLNAKGRQKFTETLVSELLGRLRSAESKQPDNFRSGLAMNRSQATDEDELGANLTTPACYLTASSIGSSFSSWRRCFTACRSVSEKSCCSWQAMSSTCGGTRDSSCSS